MYWVVTLIFSCERVKFRSNSVKEKEKISLWVPIYSDSKKPYGCEVVELFLRPSLP